MLTQTPGVPDNLMRADPRVTPMARGCALVDETLTWFGLDPQNGVMR
jgi:hypothetical protein